MIGFKWKQVIVTKLSLGNDLKFADVKKIISEHLHTALGIEEFDITYAKRGTDFIKRKDVWNVNVEFKKKDQPMASSALFSIDAKTGDVVEFQKDTVWTM